MLLETIYGAFDQIAKKRSVFKVETIGDCYVAVTGVPVPQSDHAVIMAKFARDLLETLKEELKKLEHVLGSETLHLAMRVGLHSGPVTAGVLRGEKARFQLFGDTMNTAARMESSSARNRIHVSEATANLLIEAGKSSWVTKRQDTVVAKGKGEMQTYWVGQGHSRAPEIAPPEAARN
jgi:class 3 adenylate cyclase